MHNAPGSPSILRSHPPLLQVIPAGNIVFNELPQVSMRIGILLLAAAVFPPLCRAQVPVYVIAPQHSTIKFKVKASVLIEGRFDKWDATLTFASHDVSTGVLNVNIQAASVDTGSGMKNRKLKGKDFFNVEQNPLITFRSKKMIQTGPNTFDVPGTFTIRGVSNPETLKLTVSSAETGSGAIAAAMAFNRKGYEMNGGIPFIKIADLVEVDIHLKVKRVSGSPLLLK
jgi:polyisoprenoid-binding protein YceI